MIRSTGTRLLLATLQLAALLALPAIALAGQHHLPPDVDLDPDRGMSFVRLPKTSFERSDLEVMKKMLSSRAMDPTIEPYNSPIRSSRYDASTGRIRDSINDNLREMRHSEDVARQFSGNTKAADVSPFAPQPPPNPLASMPKPARLMRNPVVDPIAAMKKQQRNDQKDDDD
jgi:hypothetical protein